MSHLSNAPGGTPGDTPASTYAEQAAAQDKFLDEKLAGIRAHEAAGDVTVREAADLRVEALEHHIQCVRNLREEYFGNGEPS